MSDLAVHNIRPTDIFQHLIAPVIVGVVVICGQFVVQPSIQERVASRTDLSMQKRELYIDALALVDKKYDSLSWPNASAPGAAPTDAEINKIYRELLLVADDAAIIRMFREFMDTSSDDGYHSAANRGEFLLLMRSDLNQPSTNLAPGEIPYFRRQSQ